MPGCHRSEVALPGGACVRVASRTLGAMVSPRLAASVDPAQAASRALDAPIASPPLAEMARPGRRVALIIDDITRPTPTRAMLPLILERLRRAGVREDHVSIVVALGTHRPMTEAELDIKVGPDVRAAYKVVNVAADDDTHLRHLGTSDAGVPIWVNEAVAGADLRLGLGMIVPHMDAGFGGGAKIVLPGVCGTRTVEAFHANMAFAEDNPLGREDAPLRRDLEAFVAENVPLHMIVNTVPTMDGGVHACVAGHPIEAHRAGARLAMDVFGVPVDRRFPLVLAGAHPFDQDFWQATKALAAAERMTAEGGTIILHADCAEGFGPHPLFPAYCAMDPAELRRMVAQGQVDDRTAAGEGVAVGRIMRRFRVVLAARGLDAADVAPFGMVHYPDPQTALDAELDRLAGQNDTLAVLTHGATTVPVVAGD